MKYLLITLVSIILVSCKTNQSEGNGKNMMKDDLSSIKIPKTSSENEFKDLQILDWGYDYFEENLFDSIQKNPIKKSGFETQISGNIYPYGRISRPNFPIYFYLKTQKEAGLIEPIIVAYMVDQNANKIVDSLEVHKRFEWEGSYHKYFEITKDSILIIYEKENYDPNYGMDEKIIINNNTVKNLKINKYSFNFKFTKLPS
jgi:hypothetical protein